MKTSLFVENPMNVSTCFHSIHSTKIQRNIENLIEIHSTKFPNAIDSAKFRSRSHDAVIRVYDEAGNVIETHEHAGKLKSREF